MSDQQRRRVGSRSNYKRGPQAARAEDSDPLKAQVDRIAHTNGILSPQSWSQHLGLDYDQEQKNLAQHLRSEGGQK